MKRESLKLYNLDAADISPVVSVKENFDDLLIPQDHPGRSESDTFYLDANGQEVLRTHTSTLQIPTLKTLIDKEGCKEPLVFSMTADVYRPDAIDSTHYPVFHQMEGFAWFPLDQIPSSSSSSSSSNEQVLLESFHPDQCPEKAKMVLDHLAS